MSIEEEEIKTQNKYQGCNAHSEERPCEDTGKTAICKPNREACKENKPASTLIVDFWPLELRDNTFLLLKPSLWYFIMATLAN